MKNSNTFLCIIIHFCRCCLQSFSTEEMLKHHIEIALKLLAKEGLRSLKIVNTSIEMLNSKILKEK